MKKIHILVEQDLISKKKKEVGFELYFNFFAASFLSSFIPFHVFFVIYAILLSVFLNNFKIITNFTQCIQIFCFMVFLCFVYLFTGEKRCGPCLRTKRTNGRVKCVLVERRSGKRRRRRAYIMEQMKVSFKNVLDYWTNC